MAKNLETVAVKNLLTLASACAEARGTGLARISTLCHGDSRTLGYLEKGSGSITLRKYDEAMAWLRKPANWPKGSKIPKVPDPWSAPKRRKAKSRRPDDRVLDPNPLDP